MANQLNNQTSPYLLQHAENPVDWYPWNETSLEKAKQENKPILLSIGYSACHWCHVMAHESFEDPDTAELMNELFINIKVDREERPDLDKIYQTAHQVLTQRPGGWPLTLFLRPQNHMPFFAGTYFPNESTRGMPAFKQVLRQVHDWYQTHPDELKKQNQQLDDILLQINNSESGTQLPGIEVFQTAYDSLANSFDQSLGGFSKAPKFPHPTNLVFLLRYWNQSIKTNRENTDAKHMFVFTLQQMALGGMYDQIGGGFCRYSVDDQWMIPHFEKMLYDNGPLLSVYAEAYAATGINLFKTIVTQTAQWVMQEMQSPGGGYYSTLDADSEGEEGRYYVWTQEELAHLMTDQEYEVAALRYGFDRPPNFEDKWNPHVYTAVDQICPKLGLDETTVADILNSVREKMFKARKDRVFPGRDEKILTSWNALMIRGMSMAARYLRKDEYARSAINALDFIKHTLWQDNRLLATHKDGKTHLNAYLDDYAYMIDAILELLQYEWHSEYLQFSCELAEVLLEQFEDHEHGGFYFTSNDHENLIQRPKPFTDEATPAGNGVAAYALQRLGSLVGDTRYIDAANRCLVAGSNSLQQYPYACMSLLSAMEEHEYPVKTIIIRGRQDALTQWRNQLATEFQPRQQVFFIDNDAVNLPDAIATKRPMETVVGYVCEGMTCSAPFNSLDDLLESKN